MDTGQVQRGGGWSLVKTSSKANPSWAPTTNININM